VHKGGLVLFKTMVQELLITKQICQKLFIYFFKWEIKASSWYCWETHDELDFLETTT
jgi:hypothetical protein